MPTAQLFVQPCCSGVTPLETSERIRPHHLGMERVQMMTGCTLTLSRKASGRIKVKNQHQRGNRTTSTTNTSSTDINTCNNCGKPGHWAKDCGNSGGGAYVNSTYRNTGKGKSKHTSKRRGKHVDVVETEKHQPSETASTVPYPSQDTSVIAELSCISSWRTASRLSNHVSRTEETVA